MREVIRYIQSARKNAGLNVDDRIILRLDTGEVNLREAIDEHIETIKSETLTVAVDDDLTGAHTEAVNVEKMPLAISLAKAE